MKKILSQKFFARPTLKVAKDLLGKFLVRRIGKKEIALRINEVEAYHGFADKASHAHRGKTKRTEVMFREAGHLYVYFTYGRHWLLNIVTGKKDFPAAILIRGGTIRVRRRKQNPICFRGAGNIIGPARLTKYLKIDRKLNGKTLGKKSGLWLEDKGVKIKPRQIKKTPRVGVEFAGPVWAKKHWRFLVEGK